MDTQVVPETKFKAKRRGPQGSSYDELIDQLLALEDGFVLAMPAEAPDTAAALRARIQTGIRDGLKRRGINDRVKFSCRVQEDGKSIGLSLRKPVKKPVAKKPAAKKPAAKKPAAKKRR